MRARGIYSDGIRTTLAFFHATVLLLMISCAKQSDLLLPFGENGRYGYCDRKGRVVIELNCEEGKTGRPFSKTGFAKVYCPDGRQNRHIAINRKGEQVLPEGVFLHPMSHSEELFDLGPEPATKAGLLIEGGVLEKVGYVNQQGEWVIPPSFNTGFAFSDDLAVVGTNDGMGYINQIGDFVIEPQFEHALSFSEGRAFVQRSRGAKFEVIDELGNTVTDARFENMLSFSDGYACVAVRESGGTQEWGLIDRSGDFVLQPVYERLFGFSEGLVSASISGSRVLIDIEGDVVFGDDFSAFGFHDGYAVIEKDGKQGVIDRKGKIVIEPEHFRLGPFAHGVFQVLDYEDRVWRFIDLDEDYLGKTLPVGDRTMKFYEKEWQEAFTN